MAKGEMSAEQRKLNADLWIIAIASLLVLGAFAVFQKPMSAALKNEDVPILVRVAMGGALQFGLAGLGIAIVLIRRKESFAQHGLRAKNIQWALLFSALCVLPYLAFLLATKGQVSYLPFQTVLTTREVLGSGFPISVLGIGITAVCWGFFEGFNYIVISNKINKLYPSKSTWLNWGALVCSVICVLVHGAIGITPEGIAEILTILFLVYGMVIVKEYTGNAWGAMAIFVLFWNAVT